jgi:DNA repair protein RadC
MSEAALLKKPHYTGHRQRLRERILHSGTNGMADYELLEVLLFSANPRGDTKPLAKELIAQYGSLAAVLSAVPEVLETLAGSSGAATLAVVREAALRMIKSELAEKPVIQSWKALLDYCRASMAHNKTEQFRILFLDKKHRVIADELQQEGTVDHTPVYPREVVKRALELGASALILVHNHPSGDPTPSKADIEMTRQIVAAAAPLSLSVHDHLVIGGKNHFSFKSQGLI